MKNIFYAVLFVAFILNTNSTLQAQFGIRVGGHLAKQEVKSNMLNFSYKTRAGLDLGIFYGFEVADGILFQPEVHFIQKGYKINDLVFGEDVLSTLNYIEIPLTAKLIVGEEAKFFLQAGPSIGYLINGSLKQDDFKEDLDLEENSRLEIGGLVSAGVHLGAIALDARYLLGFTGTVRDVNDGNVFNRGIGAGVSILF